MKGQFLALGMLGFVAFLHESLIYLEQCRLEIPDGSNINVTDPFCCLICMFFFFLMTVPYVRVIDFVVV